MPTDPNRCYDGQVSFIAGMNAAVAPCLVADGQSADARNVAFRGGYPANRPAFVGKRLVNADGSTGGGVITAFQTGNFQGAAYYDFQGYEWLFASVAGRLYRFTLDYSGTTYPASDGNDVLVEDVTPDAGNNPDREMVWFAQADRILVMQDGQSPAYLVTGSGVRRANLEANEVPVGSIMAYGFGRLWLAIGTPGGNRYVAGDIYGTATDSVIKFTETQYLAENGSFQLPAKFGIITAMKFYDQQDTATGQGPLMVFGVNGAESVNVTLPRTEWQTQQIQVEALTNIGARGHRSTVNVNGDLFFRAGDGWRSYRQARAEQSRLGQLPLSTQVRLYTNAELQEQLIYGSAIFFNNRLIVTAIPQKAGPYPTHVGALSLDFDVIDAPNVGGGQSPPAWDGFWTGPRPVAQLVSGAFRNQERAFAFTSVVSFTTGGVGVGGIPSVVNDLSEIVEGRRYDDDSTAITSRLETRAFNCAPSLQNAPFAEKLLLFAEVFESNRFGATTLAVDYRPDELPVYQTLAPQSPSETTPTSIVISGGGIIDAPALRTVRNRTYAPADFGNTIDTRINRRFYSVQFRLTWTGSLSIQRFRLAASTLPDSARSGV